MNNNMKKINLKKTLNENAIKICVFMLIGIFLLLCPYFISLFFRFENIWINFFFILSTILYLIVSSHFFSKKELILFTTIIICFFIILFIILFPFMLNLSTLDTTHNTILYKTRYLWLTYTSSYILLYISYLIISGLILFFIKKENFYQGVAKKNTWKILIFSVFLISYLPSLVYLLTGSTLLFD